MHFGMTGMIKLRNVASHLIFMENGGDKKVLQTKQVKVETTETATETTMPETGETETVGTTEGDFSAGDWPPRFTKFELAFQKSDGESLDFAFTDPRRLGRVRVFSGPEYATDEQLMRLAPLKALGPDYSKKSEGAVLAEPFVRGDPDPHHHGRPRLELAQFAQLVLAKKKPIKALLLDQDQFAGVGNWVSDEICYHARIHPGETLLAKIDDPEHDAVRRLYHAIIYIMEKSVEVEGNVREFPDDWLMLYRWGKGRKAKATTKEGYAVTHETIGGRTSCFVPELQKMMRKERAGETTTGTKETKKRKLKPKEVKEEELNGVKEEANGEEITEPAPKRTRRRR